MDPTLETSLRQHLDTLTSSNRLRRLRPFGWSGDRLVTPDGRRMIDVCSNDYLSLSRHPFVTARAAEWALRHGAGAPASRLITGTLEVTALVEEKLAAFKGCEAALLLSTGFQANATVLPALARIEPEVETTIYSDALNHVSIVHGCRAARVKPIVFRHNDLSELEDLLRKGRERKGRRLIVTESVFSMDGDRADIPALAELADQYGAILYIDEAHATGVLGPGGRGLAALCPGRVDVVMGTLGKALGAFGAYIAGSRRLIDYLINRCAGFIYTTALPPAVLGAVDAALELVPGMDAERARLAANGERLRSALELIGYDTLDSSTQIVPAVAGDEAAALAAARSLEESGILAIAIRPPTVPPGTSRLRLTLNAGLGEPEMQALLSAVARLPVRCDRTRHLGYPAAPSLA